MKLISWLGLLGFIFWACNNSSNSSNSNKAADSTSTMGSDSLQNDQSNTVNRMGDTSSYERMSQKIMDSTARQ